MMAIHGLQEALRVGEIVCEAAGTTALYSSSHLSNADVVISSPYPITSSDSAGRSKPSVSCSLGEDGYQRGVANRVIADVDAGHVPGTRAEFQQTTRSGYWKAFARIEQGAPTSLGDFPRQLFRENPEM